MSETKTNDTMKTKNTMNDASKCVSLAPRLSRAKSHAYARHQESRKRLNKTNPFQHPDAHKTFDAQYVATHWQALAIARATTNALATLHTARLSHPPLLRATFIHTLYMPSTTYAAVSCAENRS